MMVATISNLISLVDARKRSWDVIAVGSSFASMFFIKGLNPDLSVLVVERGGWLDHPDLLDLRRKTGASSFPEVLSAELQQRNHSKHKKTWVAHQLFGGNSNCWWACTPRLHPNDYRMRSLYGKSMDWPLDYADLEDAYFEVEQIMEINGSDPHGVLPRKNPFPHPAHEPSRSDVALRQFRPDWIAQPSARATTGSRTPCCANGVCGLCPVDAKFTITNSLDKLLHPGVRILLGAEARGLESHGGQASALVVRTADGAEEWLRAGLFALGANSIANVEILLRSGFQAKALGCYLHEQASQLAWLDIAEDNYFGGTSITGHGYGLYDGEHRSSVAGVLVENFNAPPGLRTEPGRWLQRIVLKFIAEDVPQESNKVVLEGDRPVIEWQGHDDYAYQGLERARARVADLVPFAIENATFSGFNSTEGHIQGTTRMGTSIEDGVVDRDLVTFERRNVCVLGAGVFPSCSPANPTLTLSALSLRAARQL